MENTRWTLPSMDEICNHPENGWQVIICANRPTREFYIAVAAGFFLWFGPDILHWGFDLYVRIFHGPHAEREAPPRMN